MKTKHATDLIRSDITTVKVYFEDALRSRSGEGIKPYTFKLLRNALASDVNPFGVAKESLVVVASGDNSTFKLARVTEVHENPQFDPDFDGDYKWIVAAVDLAAYQATLDHEAKLKKLIVASERHAVVHNLRDRFDANLAGDKALQSEFRDLLNGNGLPQLAAPVAKVIKASGRKTK